MAGCRVPYADVIDRAGSEQVRVASWEGNVVDTLIMASISQLGGDSVSIAPVDGGLGGAGKEVSGVGSERDGGASAHELSL